MVTTAAISPSMTPRASVRLARAEISVSVCLDCSTPIPARLVELSRADLKILTDRPLRYGTPVQLALFSDLVTAVTQNRGVVHWCRTHQSGWQIGIFLTMPLPDRLTESVWSDLRSSLRYECNWKAWILWESDGQLEPAWISNYSVNGLCLSTDRSMPQGSKFTLFGATGASGRAVLNGEVQWTHHSDGGVSIGCLIHGMRGRDLPRMFGKLDAVHVSPQENAPSFRREDSLETQSCELAAHERFLIADQPFSSRPDEYAFLREDA